MTRSELTSLPSRLTAIDETNRGDHWHLTDTDRCVFFGEYFSRQRYDYSPTNQLISNFKIEPTKRQRLVHKERAVQTIAGGLRNAMTRAVAERYTWVPVPGSKVRGHPDYDDRLLRALVKAFSGYNADIRCLLTQAEDVEPDHTSGGDRISPDRLFELLAVDRAVLDARPLRKEIALFDDLLTTGKHFKACARRLREVDPTLSIIGVFVARRILPKVVDDFENLDDLLS